MYVNITPEKTYTNLENLFNGDKALGQSMNSEMKPVIDDTVGEIIKNIMNNVYAKYPQKDLFLQN